ATAASQEQLRASLEQIKAQMTSGAATPELQQILADLDATAQAREAAIGSGTCDVSDLDQKLNALGVKLQQAAAAASTGASPGAASSGASATQVAGTSDASTGAATTQPGNATTPAGSGTGASGGDSLDQMVQVIGKLFKMFQSLGGGSGDGKSGGS